MLAPISRHIARATVLAFTLAGPAPALAGTYKVVFHGNHDESYTYPTQGILALDTDGDLLGNTDYQVFELPVYTGYSREILLYNLFSAQEYPTGGMTVNAKNVISGTTNAGGTHGDGTIFDLGKPQHIALAYLHSFGGTNATPPDGSDPTSGLTPGPNNRYYGTTLSGGKKNLGTIFSVLPSPSNPIYHVLHSFGKAPDGDAPGTGRLVVDTQGRLYGVTTKGGAYGAGTVFLEENTGSVWSEQVIFSFAQNGSAYLDAPKGNIVLDAQGDLYGCARGGAYGVGGVYQLAPPTQAGGAWAETVLTSFADHSTLPGQPAYNSMCNLAIDPQTDLIVGTSEGGGADGMGTLFTLTPPQSPSAAWTLTVVHSFAGNTDGAHPLTAPLEVNGTFYGGNSANGSIYAFTP